MATHCTLELLKRQNLAECTGTDPCEWGQGISCVPMQGQSLRASVSHLQAQFSCQLYRASLI